MARKAQVDGWVKANAEELERIDKGLQEIAEQLSANPDNEMLWGTG